MKKGWQQIQSDSKTLTNKVQSRRSDMTAACVLPPTQDILWNWFLNIQAWVPEFIVNNIVPLS
jgi:hypothetical protein